MNTELLWYTGRATGMVSLALLTGALVLGIVGRSGRPVLGLTRFAIADVHRNASLMALAFVCVHLVVLWLDPYATLRVTDMVIPFGAVYRPLWVGLGTLGMQALVVVVATSLLRRRLGARAWRLVHWLAYLMWPFAWLHAWFSGTDAGRGWFRLLAVACLVSTSAAVAWRLSPRFVEIMRPAPTAQGARADRPR